MEERESPWLWKFGDSAFTWGGIGVIVGSALVSPAWFKATFIAGGIAIGIGLLRSGPLKDKSVAVRIITSCLLLLILGTGWFFLWKVIPKPAEPLTKEDVLHAVHEALNAGIPTSTTAPMPTNPAARDIAVDIRKELRKSGYAPTVGEKLLANDDVRKRTAAVIGQLNMALSNMKVTSDRINTRQSVTKDPQAKQELTEQAAGLSKAFMQENEQTLREANHLRRVSLERLGRSSSEIDRDPWFTSLDANFGTQIRELQELVAKLPS